LVTHHVELVLPGAYYYVQMQDGRIHVQGKVHELRQKGILEESRPELIAEEPEDEVDMDHETDKGKGKDKDANKPSIHGASRKEGRRPRRLVQEEARPVGGVRWIIYDTYLKASYVISLLSSIVVDRMCSGYFTWVIIFVLIAVAQLFGFFEKVSLMTSCLVLLPIGSSHSFGSKFGERLVVMNLAERILMGSRRMVIPNLRSNNFLLLPHIWTTWIKFH
jgi:hypothetical protein